MSKIIGTLVLAAGLICLAHGAVGFWVIKSLPPNGGASGRLPSLYVMGAGISVAFVGLTVRGLRFSKNDGKSDKASPKGIPTLYGIIILFGILALLIFVISRQ
jgi:hypothetical protein